MYFGNGFAANWKAKQHDTHPHARRGPAPPQPLGPIQRTEMRLPALQVRQGRSRTLYSFAVDGKLLPRFSTVSRIHRDANTGVHGYQRPEVLSHISAIRKYLESDDPMIPNAVVIASTSGSCSSPPDPQTATPLPARSSSPSTPNGWMRTNRLGG